MLRMMQLNINLLLVCSVKAVPSLLFTLDFSLKNTFILSAIAIAIVPSAELDFVA